MTFWADTLVRLVASFHVSLPSTRSNDDNFLMSALSRTSQLLSGEQAEASNNPLRVILDKEAAFTCSFPSRTMASKQDAMIGLRHRKTADSKAELPASPKETSETLRILDKTTSLPLPSHRLTSTDRVAIALLTIAAILTRFFRLSTPPAVVFDELHFSKFVDRLLQGIWFFDIHPPLGKLILAYVSYIMGYRPDPNFIIEKIGNPYPEHVRFVLVRAVSATFSVATVPVTYLIARSLLISPLSSTLATCAVLLDFLGIIEGRLILMDSQLLFFCQISLLCALHLWRTQPGTRKRVYWLWITGTVAGAALSIKHTALATPGLIAIVSFFGIHFLREPLDLMECVYAAACGLAVYTASFFIMFKALWKTGGKYDKFMPAHFRRTLIGAAEYDPNAKRVSFWKLFRFLNRRMLESNANIKKRHTWESDWYQWIANWRGVLYYLHKQDINGVSHRTQIYLLGNPVVVLLTLACVAIFIFLLCLNVRYRKSISSRANYARLEWIRSNGIFLLSGWLCNLLPYILVDRAAFIYHYLPGLFYGQLLSALLFDLLHPKVRVFAVSVTVAGMCAAFVYWSPWIYAYPLPNEKHDERRWLPRWK